MYDSWIKAGAEKAFVMVRSPLGIKGIKVEEKCVVGAPAEEIVKEIGAYKPDLVVMGAKGKTNVKKLFMGSVTNAVLAGCDTPVLLVREKPAPAQDALRVGIASVGTHYKKFALASCSFHAGCEHREILRASKLLVLYNAFTARKASGNFRHHSCQFRIIIKFTGLTDFLNFILNVVSQGCTFNDTIGLIYHEIVDFGCFPAYF